MGREVISLADDYDTKRVYSNSYDERALSRDSLYALLSDDDNEEDCVTVTMPPPIFLALEM